MTEFLVLALAYGGLGAVVMAESRRRPYRPPALLVPACGFGFVACIWAWTVTA